MEYQRNGCPASETVEIPGGGGVADLFLVDNVRISSRCVVQVSEPGSMILLGTGILCLIAYRPYRRKRDRQTVFVGHGVTAV